MIKTNTSKAITLFTPAVKGIAPYSYTYETEQTFRRIYMTLAQWKKQLDAMERDLNRTFEHCAVPNRSPGDAFFFFNFVVIPFFFFR